MSQVGRAEAGAGEAEISAKAARTARQEPAAADIREEADAGLGHRELAALGDDAVRAMDGDADAAAHDHAVDEGDVRFRVGFDAVIELVFMPVELARQRLATAAGLGER